MRKVTPERANSLCPGPEAGALNRSVKGRGRGKREEVMG